MTAVYKYLNGLSLDIMSDIFKVRENTYNPRNFHIFESQNPRKKKRLAERTLHIELVNFGKMILKKLEIQPHFLSLKRK